MLYLILKIAPAGFEPAPPKRTELKSVALDHSAIVPLFVYRKPFGVVSKITVKKLLFGFLRIPPVGFEPTTLRLPC